MINGNKFWVSKSHEFIPPKNKYYPMTESYFVGGVAIGDISEGWNKYTWKVYIKSDGIYIKRTDLKTEQRILEITDVTQVDCCFDQNMNFVLVFVKGNKAFLYNYKNATYEVQELEQGATYPRIILDKQHQSEATVSDVIIGYIKNHSLYYLVQREEFLIPHLVMTDKTKTMLWRLGITKDQRIGFNWR